MRRKTERLAVLVWKNHEGLWVQLVLRTWKPISGLMNTVHSWFLISTVLPILLKSHIQPFRPLLGTGQYEVFPTWLEEILFRSTRTRALELDRNRKKHRNKTEFFTL